MDYLLWLRRAGGLDESHYTSYRFRYRSSVEHFYPQQPDPDSQIDQLGREVVDRFGNICLMSRSENSRRSNFAPAAKIGQFRSDRQSLKFQAMEATTRERGWAEAEIEAHGRGMVELLEWGVAPSDKPPLL